MHIAGIIAEYDPLHHGHSFLLQALRRRLGPEGAIVCAMSGDFLQRGAPALLDRWARAEAAVKSGADLVLELPLPWAVQSAEGFARGGVETLHRTGVVDILAFGSESGDPQALMDCAHALDAPAFPPLLRRQLSRGISFAAARQAALSALVPPETAAAVAAPNDNLGVEYCRSLTALGAKAELFTVPRRGGGHDAPIPDGYSASAVRRVLREGRREEALPLMTPAMAEIFRREEAARRAPVWIDGLQTAILARLRSMAPADFDALDTGREGAGRRLYHAVQRHCTLEDILSAAKTKRFAHARVRRMVLWAYLGLRPQAFPQTVPYLRVLAANARGRAVLSRMRKTAAVPVLTRPAAVRSFSPAAQALFAAEARCADLYALAFPAVAPCGRLWRQGPVMV